MKIRPLIIADDNIPFLKGRLEKNASVKYADQFGFTPELVKDADAMMIRTRTRCNRELLEDSSVKIIATATIGMDQFDIPYCSSKGIRTINAPGCNAPGVAQYVWSSIIRLRPDFKNLTVGIVGCGNVGRIVEEWGRAMGVRILVCDPPRKERGETGEFIPLHDLLKESDVVTLHTPLTKAGNHPTYHLIDKKEIELMKPGALLINAARGSVLNQIPLIEALRGGNISAVIDTWENEPKINTELLDLAEIATFHIAGYSFEGKQRATRMAIEAIDDFFGFKTDTSDLAAPYQPGGNISEEVIVNSYNPYDDTMPLRDDPEGFDILRANYNFRKEPDFKANKQ